MRLPGTEEWDKGAVDAEIDFELAFAASASSLHQRVAQANYGAGVPEFGFAFDADFALGRAAELAFAMGDVERGVEFCREIAFANRARTHVQTAFFAMAGSLAGQFNLALQDWGVAISEIRGPSRNLTFEWPTGDSSFLVNFIRQLIPAAAASGPARETLGGLFEPNGSLQQGPVISALLASEELNSISPSFLRHGPERLRATIAESDRAITALEENYAGRLAVMRSDTFHWNAMMPSGALIDWSLLCVWISLLRRDYLRMKSLLSSEQSDTAAFIRALARQIISIVDARDDPQFTR